MLQRLEIGQKIRLKKPIAVDFIAGGSFVVMAIEPEKGIVQIECSESYDGKWSSGQTYWVSQSELWRKGQEI